METDLQLRDIEETNLEGEEALAEQKIGLTIGKMNAAVRERFNQTSGHFITRSVAKSKGGSYDN